VPGSRIQAQTDKLRAAFDLTDADVIHCDTHGGLEDSELASIQALRNIPWNRRVLFVGINFNSALGSLAAADTLDRQANTAVIAQNASARIRRELARHNRMLIGAVDFFPQHYGAKIIPLALSILQGRPVPPAVYIDHLLLTPQNISQVYAEEISDGKDIVGRHISRGAPQ
jgi:ribose transport system substrate-binding protein